MLPVRSLEDGEASVLPEPRSLEAERSAWAWACGAGCHAALQGPGGPSRVLVREEKALLFLLPSRSQSSCKTHQNNGGSPEEAHRMQTF